MPKDDEEEEEDPLNSSLTPMDWLPRLNAKSGTVQVFNSSFLRATQRAIYTEGTYSITQPLIL